MVTIYVHHTLHLRSQIATSSGCDLKIVKIQHIRKAFTITDISFIAHNDCVYYFYYVHVLLRYHFGVSLDELFGRKAASSQISARYQSFYLDKMVNGDSAYYDYK